MMTNAQTRYAFIGGGNMAEAIIAGVVRGDRQAAQKVTVADISPERRAYLQEQYGVNAAESNAGAVGQSKVVVLAVKPYLLDEVKAELAPALTEDHLTVSILAGISRARLADALGHPGRMVRVMPNLPAQVGCGVSAITFPEGLAESERNLVRPLFEAAGAVVEVEEDLQDVVTAVSGSGPGYLFELARAWIAAAEAEGLPPHVARTLVVQTMLGAATVLQQRDEDPAVWAQRVATPGGTTEAGLKVLADHDMSAMLHQVVHQAAQRSRELNQGK